MSLRLLNPHKGELNRYGAERDTDGLISILIPSFADDPSGLNCSRRYPYISMSVWGLSVWNIPDPRLICKEKKTQLKCNSIHYWSDLLHTEFMILWVSRCRITYLLWANKDSQHGREGSDLSLKGDLPWHILTCGITTLVCGLYRYEGSCTHCVVYLIMNYRI